MNADHDAAGAPERLDIPFELKSLATRQTEDGSQEGVFEGLASTFGTRDRAGDVIEPGAFRTSLARAGQIKMLWQHDPRAPIGVWERIAETPAGLAVKGRLVLEVQRAREALALLRAGAVDALSIGFSVPKSGARFEREHAQRRLSRIDLWEVSIVTFPANPEARVARVKSRIAIGAGDLPSERAFERYLTRDAGFSRSQARTIVGSGYKALMNAFVSGGAPGGTSRGTSSARDAGQGSGPRFGPGSSGDLEDLAARVRRAARLLAAGTSASPRAPKD
jgi:HK97 family phage prohead protease